MKKILLLALILMGFSATVWGKEIQSGQRLVLGKTIKAVIYTAYLSSEIDREKEIPPNNNYVPGTRYGKPIPDIDVDDTSTDGFFANSLFVGDSLMEGFKRYCQWKGDDFMGGPRFFSVKSFSLYKANKPVSENSLHPTYEGEKMKVEDAVVKSGADRVFLFFGINDMVGGTPEEVADDYNDLIYRIHEKAPDVKIYIIGATYIAADRQKNGFTNENLRKLNDFMYKYTQNYDYMEFVNIGDRLVDSTDGLNLEYSSDNYVHITSYGYDVWAKVLKAYAKDFMAEEAEEAEKGA